MIVWLQSHNSEAMKMKSEPLLLKDRFFFKYCKIPVVSLLLIKKMQVHLKKSLQEFKGAQSEL